MLKKTVAPALRNDAATAAGDRCDVNAPAPLDVVRIAQEAFGFAEPARKIEDFARFMAAAREGEALSGEPGGASARLLMSAANAAEDLSGKLKEMRIFELVDALRPGEPNAVSTGVPNAILPLRRDAEGVFAFMATLEAMPAKLRQLARSNKRGRGRPSTTEAVDFAVAALVGLWCEYRADPPTTDVKRGTFGAMAVDVLTSAPVGFSESTVRAAMARVLKEPGRSAPRKVAVKLQQEEPEEDDEATPSTLIVVVDPDDQVGVQAALAYAENGCRVVLVKEGSKNGQAGRQPLPGVKTIDAAPLTATKKLLGALARHGAPFDTVIVAGLGAKPGDGIVGRRGGLPAISSSALAEHAVRRPAGLACLLGELRQQKLLRRGARVVVLVSAHGVIAQNPHEDRHLARAAMRALAGTIMDISIDVPSPEWVVALVSEGWGRQDDVPNQHRYPANTAAALRNTIGRLREEHHGLSLELTGGKLPSLY